MWKSVALVAGLGGMFGAILAVAGRKLAVHTDPRIEEITNLLPGANCGSCGYPGCGGLAEAIVAGRDGVSPCLACSPDSKKKIARIMGFTGDIPLSPDLRKVARVACNGCKENAPKLYNYTGIKDCHLVSKYYGGPGKCNFGCLGFGSCVKMCPFHAISMSENGLPVIDYGKCSGCGICVRQCPQMVLYITSASTKIHLKCNNRDKGKAAMVDCSVSCISCGMCAKVCPVQAITMREDANGSLPVIDHSKCIECGLCVQKCPRHCLHKLDSITTEHEHGTVATNKKAAAPPARSEKAAAKNNEKLLQQISAFSDTAFNTQYQRLRRRRTDQSHRHPFFYGYLRQNRRLQR